MIWRVRGRRAFRAFHPSRGDQHAARPWRARADRLTITCVPGVDGEPPRVAYAIGAKVANSVGCNRLRRQLRAVMAGLAPRLGSRRYLIGLGSGASSLTFGDLRGLVVEALDRIDAQAGPHDGPLTGMTHTP